MRQFVWKDNDNNYVVAPDAEEVLEAFWDTKPGANWHPPGTEARWVGEDDPHSAYTGGWVCEATAAQWAAFNGPGVLFTSDV